MQIHYFQHVPFETPGMIEEWAKARHHRMTGTRFFAGEELPDIEGIDLLVIMGGPMNIYEESAFPFLRGEKAFITQAIDRKLPILGVCLGAQLLADCLGAKVYPGKDAEIGWFPVTFPARKEGPFQIFPDRLDVFHWHGDTFDLPEEAVRMASSAGCLNQAFIYHDFAIGLQFHLEMAEENIKSIIDNTKGELADGPYIQKADEMIGKKDHIQENKKWLFRFLDRFTDKGVK
ncbi:type 1 glutamine amidotransferase [Sporolactobacillus sp. THM7-4]|nr:type 1 glutamine amidotransferase [Sporolactobacillus sp. THM7-4]